MKKESENKKDPKKEPQKAPTGTLKQRKPKRGQGVKDGK